MLTTYKVDLHIHTCLSPCADLQMLPSAIVGQAVKRGLNAIAICDHNSAENVAAVMSAAAHTGLHVIGGMEITTSEEVHVLGIFGSDVQAQKMQDMVYAHLSGENNVRFFGEQLVASDDDKYVASCEKFLAGATRLGIGDVVAAIHELDGLAIGSHVDREAFSIIGQLGFIPPDLPLDALELSLRHDPEKMDMYRSYGLPLVTSSDAHYVDDIGRSRTTFLMEELSFSELRQAFAGTGGRESRI